MYGKIFESMYDGSLYGRWEALVTMQQLIVLADEQGVIDMTPPAIAGKTSIPLDIIEKGLEILAAPDRYSRTPGNDGVRIELMDDHRPWGWHIVNYTKYRDMVRREDKLRADRERIAERRKKGKEINGVAECRTESHSVANVAHTDTDTDTYTDINPTAWAEYVQHRKEIRKKITPLSEKKQKNTLRRFTHEEQQHLIDKTIANGWTGIFPEKIRVPNQKLTYAEQLARDINAANQ